MKFNSPRFFLIPVALIIGFSISSWALQYVVQKNDTLSSLAHKKISKTVYGKQGSLAKLLQLNSEIKNPDRIRIGQIISISEDPIAASPMVDDSALENSVATGEVPREITAEAPSPDYWTLSFYTIIL